MSSVVIAGDTSGTVTLQAPATAGSVVVTLPAANGTMLTNNSTITPSAGSVNQAALATGVAGTGPAFSAYNSGTQTVSNTTATKLVCNTESFDTANAFDSTTNYRFTPQVAGYYQINVSGYGYPSLTGVISMQIWKNGAYSLTKIEVANSNSGPQLSYSSLLYLNGSTDYVEFYAYQSSGGNLTMSAQNFSGSLVRAA